MKRYKNILEYFGLKTQLKKFNEESYELLESILDYENFISSINREHIIEEMGDCLILLTQFIAKYDIKKEELDKIMNFKLERTEQRIKDGYYEKNIDK